MKTIIILFLASILILATFQAHAETTYIKNRRLLSDAKRGYSAANEGSQEEAQSETNSEANNIGVDNNNEDNSNSPDQNTHHYLPDQDYKPRKSPSTRT